MRKALVTVFLMACGGGGSGGGFGPSAIGQSQAEQVCREDCEHDVACGTETDLELCVSDCASEIVGWARGDAVSTLFNCFSTLECGASDDACVLLVDPLPIHEEWEAGCRTELAACIPPDQIDGACEVSPDPSGGDVGLFRFIAPEIMEEIIACLDAPDCEARLSCVEAVLETHGINF